MPTIKARDLRLIAFAAVVAGVVTLVSHDPLLRPLLGMLLVLGLPGLAAVRLANGGPVAASLSSVLIVISASLAIAAIGGLALHLGAALTRPGWVLTLAAVTIVLAIAADRRAPSFRSDPVERGQEIDWVKVLSRRTLSLSATGGVLLAAAFAIAYRDGVDNREFFATQLWLVPQQQSANLVTVGIANEERDTVSYDLDITVGDHMFASWTSITLAPGGQWSEPLALPAPIGQTARAEARLFKNGDRSRIYRRVWVGVRAGGQG